MRCRTSWWLTLPLAIACGGGEASDACSDAPGVICTIAGTGANGYAGDGGPALDAKMSLPQDTLTAADGATYVLDWNNHRIRMIALDGTMQHVAGRGELGGSLDDPANSDFNHPAGLIFDESRRYLVIAAWHNSKIRRLELATGEIEDACGDGRRAYFGDDGPAMTASLDLPASLTLEPTGGMIIMDQANQVIRRVDANGVISRYAGTCVIDAAPPDGPGACAAGVEPVACPNGSGKRTCGDPMTTCTRPCTPSYAGEEGPASSLRMSQPYGQSADPAGRLAHDAAGNLYFADTANNLIRMIDTAGMVHRIAGQPPSPESPGGGYGGDGGLALEAHLNNPVDLAFDEAGTLYFTDVYNHCVRSIDTSGVIQTVVGRCGEAGYAGDGEPAHMALLKRPYGLEWADGALLISDTGNNVIRRVRMQ